MKLLYSLADFEHEKHIDQPSGDELFLLENVYVIGDRCVLIDREQKKAIRSKGNDNSILVTLPKLGVSIRKIHEQVLVLPGFNHFNWYHLITDIAFQCFKARLMNGISHVVLPARLIKRQPEVVSFLNYIGLNVHPLHTPYEAIELSNAAVFLGSSGRFSELTNGIKKIPDDVVFFHQELNNFFGIGYEGTLTKYEKVFSIRSNSDSRFSPRFLESEEAYVQQGYTSVHFGSLNFPAQLKIARSMRKMVGPHGANLVNLMFANNCVEVEELFDGYVSNEYECICRLKNISHKFIDLGSSG